MDHLLIISRLAVGCQLLKESFKSLNDCQLFRFIILVLESVTCKEFARCVEEDLLPKLVQVVYKFLEVILN